LLLVIAHFLLLARRNEAAAGCFVNCKSAFSAEPDGPDPMGSDPELLNNDIRDSTDFGAARG
jgi:hypothetical protein